MNAKRFLLDVAVVLAAIYLANRVQVVRNVVGPVGA